MILISFLIFLLVTIIYCIFALTKMPISNKIIKIGKSAFCVSAALVGVMLIITLFITKDEALLVARQPLEKLEKGQYTELSLFPFDSNCHFKTSEKEYHVAYSDVRIISSDYEYSYVEITKVESSVKSPFQILYKIMYFGLGGSDLDKTTYKYRIVIGEEEAQPEPPEYFELEK